MKRCFLLEICKHIIPSFLWEEIKELAEYLCLEELIKERASAPGVISLEMLIKKETLCRQGGTCNDVE